MVDLVRIDHFRAFESYWAIDAAEETAINGSWEEGPGLALFHAFKDEFGDLPFIAEDLGIITDKVRKLRDDLALPGMKILQFAFDHNNDNHYLPHNIDNPNCILYTGTHDNNTTNGWYYGNELSDEMKHYVKDYLGIDSDSDFHKKFLRHAMMSTAKLCVIPLQDIMGYAGDYRMNTPGTMNYSNWRWRIKHFSSIKEYEELLAHLNQLYKRAVSAQKS